jgi:hypothetical protein
MNKIKIIGSAFLGFTENGINLMSYLAMKNQDEAVRRMVDLGGKISDAIYGYAMAGNIDKVNELINNASKLELNDCIASAIRAFARRGDFDHLQSMNNYKNFKVARIIGLAEGEKKLEVTNILDTNINLFPYVVEGYAIGNHGTCLKKLIKGTSFYPLAIYHAARSGHSTLVNELLMDCGVNIDFILSPLNENKHSTEKRSNIAAYSLLNEAANGYLAGCHFSDASAILTRGASVTLCFSELDWSNGLPNHEIYMALLAHIEDQKIREEVLSCYEIYSKVEDKYYFDSSNIQQSQKINSFMKETKLNYIEASDYIVNESANPVKESITLSYLANIVKIELGLGSEENNNLSNHM